MKRMTTSLTLAALLALGVSRIGAQAPAAGAKPPEPPKPPRAMAPFDLVGTWVGVVTEDWRWRMQTPAKGDFESVPLNDAGRKVANSWVYQAKPDAETACKPFGAGGIMRMPGRIRFSWADDSTLKMEFDAGTQTRLLKFAPTGAASTTPAKAPSAPSWQGTAVATWEYAGASNVDRNGIPTTQGRGSLIGAGGGGGGRGGGPAVDPSRGGSLKVVTTNLKAGYLRKNGVPYSASATITEYFDRLKYPNGDTWLIVRTVVEDPTYLTMPFITSTNFKLEANDAKFKPTPCVIDPPVERGEAVFSSDRILR
jgi:hypothetical protein